MIRLLLRLVAWLCDVPPTGRCTAGGHYFGEGDRCQCGLWPTSWLVDARTMNTHVERGLRA